MWTNYYIREKICECCERFDEEHIWKSSGGRDFTIHHQIDKYNSWSEFKRYLKGKRIFDEYDEEVSIEDFIQLLKDKKKAHPFAHRKDGCNEYWRYIDWFYFVTGEFS